jgi:hypothetical protein
VTFTQLVKMTVSQYHKTFTRRRSDMNKYCIEGICETTGASSDVYCQSNNDNDNRTSCAFYVESIQVKHSGESGREHRERMRYCRLGREGENGARERIQSGF